MATTTKPKKAKKPPTPRQIEIKALREIERDKRSQQQTARLEQLQMEERRDRFLRLAPKRVNNALIALKRVAACSARNGYTYTDEEAVKIGNALIGACNAAVEAFGKEKPTKPKFTL